MSEHDMQALLELLEKHLGGSWRSVIEHLRDTNELADVAARIERGDVAGAIQGVEDAAKAFAIETHAAYVDSGKAAAEWLDGEVDDKLIRFDVANHRAVTWAKQNTADLVREVTQEQKDLVRRVVSDGVAAGRNPRDVARDLRDSIGLTDKQAQYVANFRKALESGDWSDALGRELLNGNDERAIRAASAADRSLSSSRIDGIVERYRANWVKSRAETIARTEGLRCLHEGTEAMFRQAIDNGDVDADALVRTWNHGRRNKNSRDRHVAIDGEQRKIGEKFSIGLMYPGDPSADASETLNCGCCLSTRMNV